MYLCQICHECSQRGEPLQRHIVYRYLPEVVSSTTGVVTRKARKEIAQEIPVCGTCHQRLQCGTTYGGLLRLFAPGPRPQTDGIRAKHGDRQSGPVIKPVPELPLYLGDEL